MTDKRRDGFVFQYDRVQSISMKHLTLKVERPAFGGNFIARHKGKVVMIRGAVLPGETVKVRIENERKDYIMASLLHVLEHSDDRIKPCCGYFGRCGGCHMQHVTYDRQVLLKQDILKDCLRRLAKIEADLSEPIISTHPLHYRLRGQFKLSPEGFGFYREHTREVIDIDNCPIMASDINEAFHKARPLVDRRFIQEVHITCGDSLIALIRTMPGNKPEADRASLAQLFFDAGFAGICIETEDGKPLHYGAGHTSLGLEDLRYTISPLSFFQSHWKLNIVVAGFVRDRLMDINIKRVLDLYAGAGNFSLPLASNKEVVAVEENPSAIEDGLRNLKINQITNCTFVKSSAEKYFPDERFDALILDPPRPGLTNKAMNNVLTMLPEVIVYISCNPATFARDLKKLLYKYNPESIRMIDFFPQTYHVEVLAVLRLR